MKKFAVIILCLASVVIFTDLGYAKSEEKPPKKKFKQAKQKVKQAKQKAKKGNQQAGQQGTQQQSQQQKNQQNEQSENQETEKQKKSKNKEQGQQQNEQQEQEKEQKKEEDEAKKKKLTVATRVEGSGGSIKPSGTKKIPQGASISIKIQPDSGNFSDIIDVTVNGVSLKSSLKQLGNGDGHLVLHKLTEDLEVVAIFGTSSSPLEKPYDEKTAGK